MSPQKRLKNMFKGLFGKRHGAARIRRRVFQVEQLEVRCLLAADPFTVLSTEFVQTTETQSIVQFGGDWKYLDNGSDQGTAWAGLGFNDAAWNEGLAQLGYGDGDEATVVGFGPKPGNKYTTTYFRHTFNVDDASTADALNLSLIRDDGAAVYLNGVELLRDGLVSAAAYNSLATQTIGGNAENTPVSVSIDIAQLPPGTLRSGANVLAVEVHQSQLDSSDLSFDLSATGTFTGVSLIVDLNAEVASASLQASDLVVDGALAASSVELLDADTAVFKLPFLPPGSHTVTIAGGAVADTEQTGLETFASVFTIAESQYLMKYNPRIQLGDAPLLDTPEVKQIRLSCFGKRSRMAMALRINSSLIIASPIMERGRPLPAFRRLMSVQINASISRPSLPACRMTHSTSIVSVS